MKKAIIFYLLFLLTLSASAQVNLNEISNPPDDSKVMTWWHWMNGNVSKRGIKRDLEAMHNAGVGGVILFDIGFLPEGDVLFSSESWWEHLSYAMQITDSLEMKFGIFNSAGWSMSGGPWIDVDESMKILVKEEVHIEGGKFIKIELPKPKYNKIYKDVAVIAYPEIENMQINDYSVFSSQNIENEAFLADSSVKSQAIFNHIENEDAYIVFDFGKTENIRRLVFDGIKYKKPFSPATVKIQYSNDGINYFDIRNDHPLDFKYESSVKSSTFSFSEIKAQYIKVKLNFKDLTGKNNNLLDDISIGNIKFYKTPGINLWEPKSGQCKKVAHFRQTEFRREMSVITNEELTDSLILNSSKMIDLTNLLNGNGTLKWDAPAGNWTIMRFGYTSTLRHNHPAAESGKGYECDKMNANATRKHFNGYVAKVNELSLTLLGKPIDFMQMESWEAGIQNWTDEFEKAFLERNGYSIIPYLPIMTDGYVVNSYEESNRFLWDLRNTVSDLMTENYWAVMHRMSKENDIQVLGEGSGMQHYLYDPIKYHKHNDVPMGEFWTGSKPRVDCKNAASVAHTYGKNIVAAEAFTGAGDELWRYTPIDFKQLGDEAFTCGVNQFVLHSFVHQPYETPPGLSLYLWGNHLQRHNVWYQHANGWFNYLSRCQHLLRQGELVTDVCYFTGEGIPGYLGLRDELNPPLPSGYDYDGVNFELIKEMTVEDGKMILPHGASYHLMIVPPDIKKMTPALIKEIKRLVKNGATIVAHKPTSSHSLINYPDCDAIVTTIAEEVWGNTNNASIQKNNFGKGEIVWDMSIGKLLEEKGVSPDFTYAGTEAEINYIHRKSDDSDIYFLANTNNAIESATCYFRSNLIPWIWDADKGISKNILYTHENGLTKIELEFDPLGSYFIIFQSAPNTEIKNSLPEKYLGEIDLHNSWSINFPIAEGTSENLKSNNLSDWITNTNDNIKHFSGTATYTNSFTTKSVRNKTFILELGEVYDIAEVYINNIKVANLWKAPYKVDISKYVVKGKNEIKIDITNSMVNRLIGDEYFEEDVLFDESNGMIKEFPEWIKSSKQRPSNRTTFVSYKVVSKNDQLEPSGLIGPVSIKMYR